MVTEELIVISCNSNKIINNDNNVTQIVIVIIIVQKVARYARSLPHSTQHFTLSSASVLEPDIPSTEAARIGALLKHQRVYHVKWHETVTCDLMRTI